MVRKVDFDVAVQLFLLDKAEEMAPGSLKGYGHTLWQADEMFKRMNIRKVCNIETVHIRRLFTDQQTGWPSRSIAPGTLNNHRQRLKTFMKWCQENAYATKDPMAGLKRRKHVPSEKVYFSHAELHEVFEAAVHPRDRMLCVVAAFTSLRISEILSMRIRDVDFDRGQIHYVEEKTSRRCTKDAFDDLLREASAWLLRYEEFLGRPLEEDMYLIPRVERPMFIGNRQSQPPEQRQIIPDQPYIGKFTMLRTLLTKLDKEVKGQKWHIFRRSGARLMYDQLCQQEESKDRALRLVQTYLGHSTRAVTEAYLGMAAEREELSEFIRGRNFMPDPPSSGGLELPENVTRLFDERATG